MLFLSVLKDAPLSKNNIFGEGGGKGAL